MRIKETDVAVIGTGAAGCAAAITALEAGKRVVVCEKNRAPGGATNTVIVVRVIRNDPAFIEKAFLIHMEMTNWLGNPDLVRSWIEKDATLDEWMERHGIEFHINYVTSLDTLGQQEDPLGGFPKGHLIAERAFLKGKGNGHGGAVLVQRLLEQIRQKGGEVLMSTPAVRLEKQEGRVTGIVARDTGGEEFLIRAKAVILCTAGFNDDREMVKKYSGFDYTLDKSGTCTEGDFFFIWNAPKLDGSGIKMAWEAGAKRGPVGIAPFAHMPGPGIIGKIPWNSESQLRIVQEQPYLWVNQNGLRFMNEAIITDHFTSGRVIANQPGKCAYLIIDEATKEHMEQDGLDYTYFIFPADHLTDFDGDLERVMEKGNRHIFIADGMECLENLCEQTGIPVENLRETIARYNAYCDAGCDARFGKKKKFLRPVREGKIYCFRVFTTAYQTIGGLKVDGRTRVLDESERPIDGLYAAGDIIAADLFGEPPICGIGNAGIALSTGIIAAEDAVKCIDGRTNI